MPRDYYDILGVSRSASAEDINTAYRKLARSLHPDRNPGDKAAEAKFKEVQNAYDTLSDPQKKAMYDQFGHDATQGGMPGAGGFPFNFGGGAGGPGGQQMDPRLAQEIFSRFFGGGAGGPGGAEPNPGRGRGRRGGAAPRAEAIEVDARIPFMTAVQGGSIGLTVGSRSIDVRVPAGFEDGKKLRVSGQGDDGQDILVKVHVDEHPYFRREGLDILLDVPISIGEAISGTKVEVPTVAGKRVDVKIPPGTSSGARVRLPGLGINKGDQYLVIKIMIPKGKPSEKASELAQQLDAELKAAPRGDVAWK